MAGRAQGWRLGGVEMAVGGGNGRWWTRVPLTPYLTSPLEGGRDEFFLGEAAWWWAGMPRGFLPAQE